MSGPTTLTVVAAVALPRASGNASSSADRNWLETSPRMSTRDAGARPGRADRQRWKSVLRQIADIAT